MVGLVLVSHSAQVAQGAVALARQMAGDDVPIVAAGGVDDPPDGIGTDAVKISAAITQAAADGAAVLVLMDLGSAILSTEVALSMIAPEVAERTRMCAAPLVEGAVAAAVAARIGGSLEEVAAEAAAGLAAKQAQLGDQLAATADATPAGVGSAVEALLDVTNANGLHARPAARFVQLAASFDAVITATNATTGAGPGRATSLTDVATLGARQGQQVLVRATGPQAAEAIAALQALAARNYDDEDAAAPASPAPPSGQGVAMQMPVRLAADGSFQGLAAAPGVAVGPARRLRRPPAAPRTPGDPAVESAALNTALDRARNEVRFARQSIAAQVGEAQAQMLDAHTSLLADHALIDPALAAIAAGQRAEVAWQAAVDQAAARFAALEDPYMRTRAEDVRDIGRRVLAQFSGQATGPATLRGPGILIARELGAGETAALDLSLVTAIAVATGSPTSHTAILARALGVPAVVDVGEVLMSISEDQLLLVDGDAGTLRIGPDPDTVARVRAEQAARAARQTELTRTAQQPAATSDGQVVEVGANIADADEAAPALAAGADGVGLFRSEFLFMNRDDTPSEDEQERAYRAAAQGLQGRRLIVRTLDAGADKPVAALAQPREENPFLGIRGLRLSLAHPERFREQLRAVLRVCADHPLGLMFPMVATVDELLQARAQLDLARDELHASGIACGSPEVGVMIEVPSAALCADLLAPHVDFFSIGTNDLTQYTMAAERGNAAVAALSDALHPAVLRLIAIVCQAARRHERWVGVCGELAADPDAATLLVGLGVRELSVAAPRIGEIKQAVRSVSADDAAIMASEMLTLDSADAVRSALHGGCSGDCAHCAHDCDHDHDDGAPAG